MKSRCAVLLTFFGSLTGAFADKPSSPRYQGEWSDCRGEVLVVTATQFRAGGHMASYKEIGRSADQRSFRFQLTSGNLAGFDGRYFSVEVSREEMRMREYRTLEDCISDRQATAVISWERDR